MALITFINNINVVSGGLHQTSDTTLQILNAGAFLISLPTSGAFNNDLSSSFSLADWETIPSGTLCVITSVLGSPMTNDLSASFSTADWGPWGFASGSFILPNDFTTGSGGGGGGGTSTVTYFLRGFYLVSGQFENWSGPSDNTPPPSGHSLIDITIMGIVVS